MLLAAGLLALLLCLISFVQLLYLESLRLRTRDCPALVFFKETLEERLGMKSETGVVSFSLIKYALMLLIAILILDGAAEGQPISWIAFTEAALAAWGAILIASFIVPHILYRRTAGEWLIPFTPLLKTSALAVRPLVFMLSLLDSVLGKDVEAPGGEETPTSAENIEALISAGAEEGLIQEDDRKLIQSVVEFGDTTVREVMTPRPNIVAMAASSSLEDLRKLVIHEQYSRIPVYGESIDEVVGFVHVRDVFELDYESRSGRTVQSLVRPIRFVPETKPVRDLMREMQQDSTHMVIVVDEYGNTAGLATMEDLVEVIVGEIRDEHEPGSDVTTMEDGSVLVSGSFDVSRLHDLFDFRPSEETESTTIGGLLSEWLGRVPVAGETIERDGIHAEVVAGNDLRVEQVRLRKAVRNQPA
ncbi:MAG TPA: hemolysin family protein [Bryobacteraceae bacterium]|nr:hemolysin family protein [Bryobacteraceae bacterium]